MAISLLHEQRQRVNGEWHTVRVYNGSIGAGSTLTIHTPEVSTNKVWLVGLAVCEADATNLTFLSSATTIVLFELAANQGVYHTLSQGPLLNTGAGLPLKLTASVAVGSILLSVIEAEVL